ncbi:MAG: hypothetical protein KF889_04125 [Alphaproteobacteria bacterium]|nr:hypothetical protein [Alphaproteobacteria bacterium]MCW5742052.1 hypothetical protein [Alphaproteobacteria bacterium]
MSASIPRRALLPLAAALLLAGRSGAQPTRPAVDFAVPDFGSRPMRLAAGRLIVTRAFVPAIQPPRHEGSMIVSASDTMADWASRHLLAALPGNPRTAVFTIREASLVGERLRVEKGLGDLFRKQAAERYTLRLGADLEMQHETGQSLGVAAAEATTSLSLLEGVREADRQVSWHNMLIAAMEQFVATFERTMRSQLQHHLAGG